MPEIYAIVRDPAALAESARQFHIEVQPLPERDHRQTVSLARLIFPEGVSLSECSNRYGFGRGTLLAYTHDEEAAREHLKAVRDVLQHSDDVSSPPQVSCDSRQMLYSRLTAG